MSLSPDGNFLLTNAMDNTLRAWDVRPYAPVDRCARAAAAAAALGGACGRAGWLHGPVSRPFWVPLVWARAEAHPARA
jgi:hypothetical protein